MNDRTETVAGPESMLSAWMKMATDFWGPLMKQWTTALEPVNGQPEGPLGRSKASWSSYLKSLTALSASMGEGGSADAVLKGIGVMPDILLRLLEGAWNSTFTLQRQIIEKAGRMGESVEAYQFEGLDQEAFKAWAEIYEQEIQQFLQVPQLGLTRFYQEKVQRTVDKCVLLQSAMAEFVNIVYLPMEQSSKVLQEKVAELAEKGSLPENPKEYYTMWVKILEGHYMTLFKTPEYTQTLSRVLSAFEDYQAARDDLLQDALKSLPVPTNRDMDALYKEIYDLKKKIRSLEKKIAQ
ncbi:MAG TPA: poly(R)-hydroxyalkanoic acid synthase subunit PhaE [Desulfobacterales bacterium]|jgi:polyhydroxyalkanoate synthase subunit PhaE|nr:poly(R)-hydroxyalkanoic acid synthase subunit PhaE [Desulfobacterales bacterium]